MEAFIEGDFLLEKFPGKGGWTFVRIQQAVNSSGKSFGMLKVSGTVDDFGFEGKHLMPLGDGFLFLPIAKVIRTAIRKEAGDSIRLILLRDEIPDYLPEELVACLEDDPGKLACFQALPIPDQQRWIEFIYSANSEEAKAERIVRLLHNLSTTS